MTRGLFGLGDGRMESLPAANTEKLLGGRFPGANLLACVLRSRGTDLPHRRSSMNASRYVLLCAIALGACSSLWTRPSEVGYASSCAPATTPRNCVSDSDCSSEEYCCMTVDSPTGCSPGLCAEQVQLMKPQVCGRSVECANYQISDHEIGFACCCEENTLPGITIQVCVPSYTCAAGKTLGITRGCI
jgi:hypothetical protein